jgi:hypothetical protein
MPADSNALQQSRAFSHDASGVMWSRAGIGVETILIGLESCPVNETEMMFLDKHAPLVDRQVTHTLFECALLIHVAFGSALAVRVSAGIYRIRQNVMDCRVSGNHPTNLAMRPVLQREGWSFRTQPEPDAARGAEFGKTFEDRSAPEIPRSSASDTLSKVTLAVLVVFIILIKFCCLFSHVFRAKATLSFDYIL